MVMFEDDFLDGCGLRKIMLGLAQVQINSAQLKNWVAYLGN